MADKFRVGVLRGDDWETPEAIISLCTAYNEVINRNEADPLLIILKIGNGRYTKYKWNWDKEN